MAPPSPEAGSGLDTKVAHTKQRVQAGRAIYSSGSAAQEGERCSFGLQVDLGSLPARRGLLQARLQPDAPQVSLELDLGGQRGATDWFVAWPCIPSHPGPRAHTHLLPFQAPFPDLPPEEPGPLDQLAVLVMVHLSPADLQYVFALHPGCILHPLTPLLGPFPHLGRRTLAELGWSHSPWDPSIQSGQDVAGGQPALQGADGHLPGDQHLLKLQLKPPAREDGNPIWACCLCAIAGPASTAAQHS